MNIQISIYIPIKSYRLKSLPSLSVRLRLNLYITANHNEGIVVIIVNFLI